MLRLASDLHRIDRIDGCYRIDPLLSPMKGEKELTKSIQLRIGQTLVELIVSLKACLI